jgi:sugar phosphate isomerase/epimerase
MGGKSPVEYLVKYAGRFPCLHIKDESIIGDSGQLDFKAIFEAAYKQGMKDYFVEVERYTDTVEKCVKISYNFLMNASYVK